MAEQLGKNFYQVKVPLPNSPLKALNSYVIKGPSRNLIVDTGMNRPECLKAMQEALAELRVDLARTDFFITHLHADHLELVASLVQEGAVIYFNRPDADRRWDKGRWEKLMQLGKQNGFPPKEVAEMAREHPGLKYRNRDDLEFTILADGDCLSCGEYRFVCVDTPGHTQGHLCLYEPARKWFIAGDHILEDITPNIQQWSLEEDLLAQYLRSLEKTRQMDIELVLPGHRGLIRNFRKRIEEIKGHHRARLEEVLRILQAGPANAYAVASRMSWDIAPNWDSFPVTQKWFATGEAIAHLAYLKAQGRVFCRVSPQGISYSLDEK